MILRETIGKLPKQKGGYYFLKIEGKIVEQFSRGKATRLICNINEVVSIRCGLNHFGDGNFFIIISSKNFKLLGLQLGAKVSFDLKEDPNPLGVDIPEVLDALLIQDEELKKQFNNYTDGKKRSLIYTINRVKNIDLQIEKALNFFEEERLKSLRKKRN